MWAERDLLILYTWLYSHVAETQHQYITLVRTERWHRWSFGRGLRTDRLNEDKARKKYRTEDVVMGL